ncbi:hypothetical protein Droror1_Dr00020191 [Drosera rotundifolia]
MTYQVVQMIYHIKDDLHRLPLIFSQLELFPQSKHAVLQVLHPPKILDLDSKGKPIFCKIWGSSTSGQVACNCRFFLLGKLLSDGFPSLEYSFLFPLLAAVRAQGLV